MKEGFATSQVRDSKTGEQKDAHTWTLSDRKNAMEVTVKVKVEEPTVTLTAHAKELIKEAEEYIRQGLNADKNQIRLPLDPAKKKADKKKPAKK